MADAGLMIDGVRAPEGAELAEKIRRLVRHFGRADEIHRIGSCLLAHGKHLVTDFGDRLRPRQALPFTVDELERIAKSAVAMRHFADGSTLCAVCAAIYRASPGWLLSGPHAVLDLSR